MHGNDIDEIIDMIFDEKTFNPDSMAKLLYASILNEFSIKLSTSERKIYSTYVSYMYDLIENLRELDITNLDIYLKKISKKDPYVIDNIIMLWSLPRSEQYMSKIMYYKAYKNNIVDFNNILFDLRNEDYIIHFCLDILSKPSKCPIHCIDIIWNCMDVNKININSIMLARKKFDFIEFNLEDQHEEDEITLSICLSTSKIDEYGLGNKLNSKGKTFNDMINYICNMNKIEKNT